MTQIFHISPRFSETARCLDTKRLGKQITEAYQVYRYLIGEGVMQGNPHPYRMWQGYEKALLSYIQAMHEEWMARFDDGRRGGKRCHKNGLEVSSIILNTNYSDYKEPHWIANKFVISSYKSALLYKNFEWYSQFGWQEKPAVPLEVRPNGSVTLPYYYPDTKIKGKKRKNG